MTDALVSGEDLLLMEMLERTVHVHGGVLPAHLVLVAEPRLRRFLGDRRLLRVVCEWPTVFRVDRDDPRGVISTLRPVPEGLGTAPCARAVHIGRLLAECVRLAVRRYREQEANGRELLDVSWHTLGEGVT